MLWASVHHVINMEAAVTWFEVGQIASLLSTDPGGLSHLWNVSMYALPVVLWIEAHACLYCQYRSVWKIWNGLKTQNQSTPCSAMLHHALTSCSLTIKRNATKLKSKAEVIGFLWLVRKTSAAQKSLEGSIRKKSERIINLGVSTLVVKKFHI